MDNEVGDRLRQGKSEPPDVPTISDDSELLDELAEKNADESFVDEVDVDESGAPMKISNGEDA
ncbi:MAG: hypothetical protein ACRENA_05435 [Vulcanimicrobiaceae bacterium]